MAIVIETTLGNLTIDLYLRERPRACLNFIKLCKLKYFNYNLFHTVERGFIAQTGDPSGVGDGGESIWGVVEGSEKRFFEAESLPKIKHSTPGLLSLVSVGKNMVGSQFFFTLGSDLTSLDGIHCVIGEVTEGHEVLRKLNEAITDDKFRPYQDIRVTHTVILEDPFEDPRGFKMPSRSPSPSAERLQNGRIGADEDIDDTDGKTVEEIQEMLAEREAKARATILEIVGDLPDADCAPPENVLFVCKLNPVTTDDDLEIIFSRFGKVKGCEVIRDKVSGDSLQYAFVEFEDQKACENAYFKMDNVLIDDRRIHVDFSQSVAKVKWRGKGRGIEHSEGKNGRLDFNNLRDRRKEDKNQSRKETKGRETTRRRRSPEKDDRRSHSRQNYFRDIRDEKRRDRSSERQNDRRNNYPNDKRDDRWTNNRTNFNENYRQRINRKNSPHIRNQRERSSENQSRRSHISNNSGERRNATNSVDSRKDHKRRRSVTPKEKNNSRREPSSSSLSSVDKKRKKKKSKKKSKKHKMMKYSETSDSSNSSEEERKKKKKSKKHKEKKK